MPIVSSLGSPRSAYILRAIRWLMLTAVGVAMVISVDGARDKVIFALATLVVAGLAVRALLKAKGASTTTIAFPDITKLPPAEQRVIHVRALAVMGAGCLVLSAMSYFEINGTLASPDGYITLWAPLAIVYDTLGATATVLAPIALWLFMAGFVVYRRRVLRRQEAAGAV